MNKIKHGIIIIKLVFVTLNLDSERAVAFIEILLPVEDQYFFKRRPLIKSVWRYGGEASSYSKDFVAL